MTLEPRDVTRSAVGFFEETPGVRSSSRLLAMLLWILTAGVAVCACIYLLKAKPPDGGVLGAMAGIITALGGWGAVAQVKRGNGT